MYQRIVYTDEIDENIRNKIAAFEQRIEELC